MSQSGQGVGLQHYLQILRRRLLIIVTVTGLVLAVSLGISLRQETIYGASSEVLVNRENLATTLTRTQVPYIDAQTAERLMETQVQLARVPALAARVIAANDLPDTPQDFLKRSSVSVTPKTDILIFTVRRSSPSLARRLATSYGNEFTKYSAERESAHLETVASGLRSQLDQMSTPDARRTPLYNDLQERLRQIQTMQALQSPTAEVVRQAGVARKLQPRPLTAGAGGLVLGLLLGTALAFLRDSLDTRARSSDEVAERLGVPLLGRLPQPPERLGAERRLILIEDPEADDAEPFHFLRSTLAFANLSVEAQVIMVTSSVQEEGKSTTVANLAVALATAGSRVVVVDADSRRPTIDRFFRIPKSPGLTDVALTGTEPAEALVKVVAPQSHTRRLTNPEGSTVTATHAALEVLPSGRPGHRVDVDGVAEILNGLRRHADIILVDAPPMLQVGDATALSARVDALLIIARLNVVRRPMLDELRRILDSTPTPTLGFVLTGAAEEAGYGGYYRRAYGASAGGAQHAAPASAPATDGGGGRTKVMTSMGPTAAAASRRLYQEQSVATAVAGDTGPPPRPQSTDESSALTGHGRRGSSRAPSDQPGEAMVTPAPGQAVVGTGGKPAGSDGDLSGTGPDKAASGPILASPLQPLIPSNALAELQELLSVVHEVGLALGEHDASFHLGTVRLTSLVVLGLESGAVPLEGEDDNSYAPSEAAVGE